MWYCFGCGLGGDVLQLVEFVQSGTVTSGVSGAMPQTHREARDWLADKAGLPPLSKSGLTLEEMEKMERDREEAEVVFRVLTRAIDLYHERLMESPEILAWVEKKYGITAEDCANLRIGWADVPGMFNRLRDDGYEERTIAGTGLFYFDSEERAFPFYKRRVVFPYISRGRVVYAIGRQTPWTDQVEPERAKYKKLPTHNERNRTFVSRAIDNSVLWGEDILLARPPKVILTEGITDAIAAWRLGLPVISPVTVRLKGDDVERIVRRLRGVEAVYFVYDNELSGVGLDGAMQTAAILQREGIGCRIATIPLGVSQEAARSELREILGEDEFRSVLGAPPNRRRKKIEAVIGEEKEKVDYALDLLDRGKIDLCEWVLSTGADRDDLRKILLAARSPVQVSIDAVRLSEDAGSAAKVDAVEPILRQITAMKPGELEDALRRLKHRTGLSLSLLRRETARVRKEERKKRKERVVAGGATSAPAGSLRELIQNELLAARNAGEAASWERIAELSYGWFGQRGAMFFRARDGSPFMFWEDELWYMASQFTGSRQRYVGMMQRHSGLVPTTSATKTFYSTLAALAADRGEIRDEFSWLHTDIRSRRIWLISNTEDNSIIRVSSEGVDVVPNGANEDAVILRGDDKFHPFVLDEHADHARLRDMLSSLIGNYLACPWEQRAILLDWVCAVFLIQFSGTRPMARFEGPAGSGKTFAAKAITTLIYGHEAQKKATDAANYADASRNPLLALDNVETQNTTVALIDFLLTAVTGITREKRARGSDSGTVAEKPLCMILSTGVEPLGGEFEEVMSRSLIFEFDATYQQAAFLEPPLLAEIAAQRDYLISAILFRISSVFRLMEREGHARAMMALRKELGRHEKTRCDEFLALMYLMRVAGHAEEVHDGLLDNAEPAFVASVLGLNEISRQTTREASPVGMLLTALFAAFQRVNIPDEEFGLAVRSSKRQIEDARPTDLFVAIRRVAKDYGLPCPFTNAVQFGKRLSSAIPSLADEGFNITRRVGHGRRPLYTIRWRPESSREPSEHDKIVQAVTGEELSLLQWQWEAGKSRIETVDEGGEE